MNADGSRFRQLTVTPVKFHNYQPAWSRDGLSIAFWSDLERSGIWVMNADGSRKHRLPATSAGDAHPTWSPDGREIAFSSLHGIRVVSTAGTYRQSLTALPGDSDPAWSPDGTKIVFARLGGSAAGGNFVMNADGSRKRRLTRSVGGDYQPAWSPDGTQIGFGRTLRTRDAGSLYALYVMSADGTKQTRLIR